MHSVCPGISMLDFAYYSKWYRHPSPRSHGLSDNTHLCLQGLDYFLFRHHAIHESDCHKYASIFTPHNVAAHLIKISTRPYSRKNLDVRTTHRWIPEIAYVVSHPDYRHRIWSGVFDLTHRLVGHVLDIKLGAVRGIGSCKSLQIISAECDI